MKFIKFTNDYFKVIILSYIVLVTLRLLETLLIFSNFGIQELFFRSELLGLIYDFISINTLLLILYPVYFFIHRNSIKLANSLFISLLIIITILHFFILKYFLYQLVPLDTFLYQYSLREILLNIASSNTSYTKAIVLLSIPIIIIFVSYRFVKTPQYSKKLISTIYFLVLVSVPIFIFIQLTDVINLNKFSKNKSLYFYSQTISFLFKANKERALYSKQDALDYQKQYPSKSYININYPLLHKFENKNVLGTFFNKFDSPPNIVILVVEGLNDDFIHSYRGVNLLPFLEKLKDKSLYWNRCFTLGERSFAVMPSVLGSLPYGEKGFTLLDKLPRHFTLVSILNANNYHTSFFYGQARWVHRKDRFFKYNNMDLIFDNSMYAEKYTKIIVGKNKFFWGYDDKDLFNQSLEVIDTLPKTKRLDIYFTGTTHSPFFITDHKHYDEQFSKTLETLKNKEDIEFFINKKLFIQTIFFANDAFEDFFEKYKKIPGYENTIFIITGDHPMTEMPRINSLKRYHVPLIIYSPKIKSPKTFSKIVSQLDIYESLLSFLSDYNIKIPEVSTALGSKLNVDESDRDVKLVFMDDNRDIVDYFSNYFYLSDQKLYSVGKDLSLTPSNDKKELEKIQNELEIFKKTSLYVCLDDKILPDELYCKGLGYNLIYSQQNSLNSFKFSSEYYDLLNSTPVHNKTIYFDISFDYSGKVDKDLSLVYQLTTKNNKMVLWKNTGISYENKRFQAYIEIPRQDISDSMLYFKSYFWNKNKQKFSFKNLRILVYEKNSIHPASPTH